MYYDAFISGDEYLCRWWRIGDRGNLSSSYSLQLTHHLNCFHWLTINLWWRRKSGSTLCSVEAAGSSLAFSSVAASTGESASMLATSFTCQCTDYIFISLSNCIPYRLDFLTSVQSPFAFSLLPARPTHKPQDLALALTCSAFFSSSAKVSCSLFCLASNWETWTNVEYYWLFHTTKILEKKNWILFFVEPWISALHSLSEGWQSTPCQRGFHPPVQFVSWATMYNSKLTSFNI